MARINMMTIAGGKRDHARITYHANEVKLIPRERSQDRQKKLWLNMDIAVPE